MPPTTKKKRSDDDDDETPSKTPLLLGVLGTVVVLGICIWFFFIRSPFEGAEVAGLVTLDGVPVEGAMVNFVGNDAKKESVVVARSDKSGNYRLIGNAGSGVALGKYKVAVSKQALRNGTVPEGEELLAARSKNLLVNILPKIYEDKDSSPIEVEVKSGSNKIDLALEKMKK